MIRTFCKLVIGLTLTGCMVNNVHHDSYSVAYKISHRETTVVETGKEVAAAPTPAPVVTGNVHIRPKCEVYVPLPIPEPIKIDLEELQEAPTPLVINAIVLQNVKDLRKQMLDHSKRQQKHYADYVRRCVVR